MIRTLFALLAAAGLAAAQVPADKALATMQVADGLQVQLFASEPMLVNPTNMDIDPLGRVWVTEAVNYRTKMRGKPLNRPEGDRIVILTDKDGDGKADESTVFYQGPELYGPLGICIVPQLIDKKIAYRVLISQSPDILEFWDKDGDGKADGPPTKFLTGFGGTDHDHGVHSIQVGPDGKFYFTVGDQGVKNLQSKDGKGRKWTSNTTDCRAGTIWRCDADGNNLELIAHNFRNQYEACVDSFGEIWCSDNDDDGNQQTRICYVMPGGNYGYHPRGKGESHWHQEQPGIVPNVLRTGFGSPCGITCYEGSLLPEKYRGQLLHVDAGPRELRCFHKKPKGAGYELDKTVMLTSTDNWFRPSDVCTAPDGSVFVCDWYDPGVGGHGMGDTTRGRIYRISPKNQSRYVCLPITDLRLTPSTQAQLACSCISSRTLAQNCIKDKSDEYAAFIKDTIEQNNDAVLVARVCLLKAALLSNNDAEVLETVEWASKLVESKIAKGRMNLAQTALGVRMLEYMQQYLAKYGKHITMNVEDRPAGIKNDAKDNIHYREVTLILRLLPADQIAESVMAVCYNYNGQDRFYLAALNIACGSDPERRDKILADFDKHFPEWNDKVADLVWELRPKCMLPKLDGLLKDTKLSAKQKARIVDIIAVYDTPDAGKTVLEIIKGDHPAEVKLQAIANLATYLPTKWNKLADAPELKLLVAELLGDPESANCVLACKLVAAAKLGEAVDKLHQTALKTTDAFVRAEACAALGKFGNPANVIRLRALLMGLGMTGQDATPAALALGEIANVRQENEASKAAVETLAMLVTTHDTPVPLRSAALQGLAGSRSGTQWLLKQQEEKKLPKEIVTEAGALLRNSPFQGERNKALILFPAAAKLDLKKLPAPAELAKRSGDARRGREVFVASFKSDAQCMKCHSVYKDGGAIGPDLSTIGKKASKENLYESILNPNKAIADQYVTWKIDTDDGQSVSGLIVRESATEVQLRDANGKDYTIAVKSIEKKAKTATSLMAEDIAKALTEQELTDLVEYLFSLKE